MPIQKVRLAAAAGVAALGAVAGLLLWSGGLPGRLSGEAAIINRSVGTNYRCPVSDYMPFGGSRACVLNLPSRNPEDADVVLMGNSHAQMYAPVLRDVIAERGLHGLLVPLNSCLPTTISNVSTECIAAARQNLDEVNKLSRARVVVIGLTWWQDTMVLPDGTRLANNGNKPLVEALDDLIKSIQDHGKRVVLIGPIAQPGWELALNYSRQLAFGHPATEPLFASAAPLRARFAYTFAHFKSSDRFQLIRPDTIECPGSICAFVVDGHSLFADDSHLSQYELQRFRPVFEQAFAKPPLDTEMGSRPRS